MSIDVSPDAEPPASPAPTEATLLSDLPLVALDTETTGLDPARDRIVAVGAVRLRGRQVFRSRTLDVLVRPGCPIPAAASAIHHITDAMVEGAPEIAEVWPQVTAWLADAAVVGHHIAFDLAMLAAAAQRNGLPWAEPFALDTAHLAAALDGSERSLDLDELARRHGVALDGRHSALGDSLIAAELYLRLLPRLLERGIVTLGDAKRFGDSAAAALRKPHDGDRSTLGDQPALRRLDVFPYLQRIGAVMTSPLATIEPHRTVREAASILAERHVSSLVLIGPGDAPSGIVTERDMVRAIAGSGADALSAPVTSIASSPVATVREGDFVHVAIGRLARLAYRHLVVVDAQGRAAGMVTARALLRQRSATALLIGDEIEGASDAAELARARGRLPGLAQALVSERVASVDIAAVLSAILRDLTRKATEISADAMVRESWGAAPAPWAVLVLGSGGRGESLLGPDQDNALVHLGGETDDGWFAELGRRVADTLDRAGIPYCRGGVMARERRWRHTLSEWESVVRHWAAAASPEDVLAADIFFDFAPVAGDWGLAQRLREVALAEVGASPMLVQHLAIDLSRTRAPIGLFGGFQSQDGRIDLKLNGLLPIVGAARALALRHAIAATSTPDRLRRLAQAGHVADIDLDRLLRAYDLLLGLVLEQQVIDAVAGRALDGRVAVTRLDRARQRRLKEALKGVEAFAQQVASGLA